MTTKGTDNRFRSLTVVGESGTPSTPGSGDFKLYVADDGTFYVMDDTGTPTAIGAGGGDITTDPAWAAKGDLIAGTGNDAAAIRSVGANDTILMADSGQSTGLKWVASQTPSTQAFGDAAAEGTADTYARGDHKHAMPANPGGVTDPITDQFGAATTTYDGSSLSGWTAFGSPDVNDADTSVQDSFYLEDKNSSFQIAGNYRSSPSTPFTLIASMTMLGRANYHQAGIFVGASTPGVMANLQITWNSDASLGRGPRVYRCTGPTDGSGTTVATIPNISQVGPCYLAIVATSTSSLAYYLSLDGYIWTTIATAHDPSTTVASIGFAVSSGTENTTGVAARFPTLYVYGSALTIPGA